MPDDYILRSDALKAIRAVPTGNWSRARYVDTVERVPAADVEPKRSTGWWMPGDYVAIEHGECVTYPGEGITCSCCHYGFKGRFLWSREYCPHCGAKMNAEPPKEEEHE